MRTPLASRRLLAPSWGALLALAVAGPAGAQAPFHGTSASGQTWVWWQSPANPGARFLNDDLCEFAAASTAIDRTCSSMGVHSSYAARVGPVGDLHARSRAQGTTASVGHTFVDPVAYPSMGLTASASAFLWDELTFGAVAPAVVRFNFALDGRQATAAPTTHLGTHATGLVSRGRLYFSAVQSTTVNPLATEFVVLEYAPPGGTGTRDVEWAGFSDVPLVGSTPLRFRVGSTTTATMHKPTSGVQSFEGLVDTDFSHTSRFSIQLFDAFGHDVTGAAVVTAASGRAYQLGAAPTAVVPEPTTTASLATGLLALAALGARRTRAPR